MDTVSFSSRRSGRTASTRTTTVARPGFELSQADLDGLIGIWKLVLKHDNAALDDHFFEVGGTSLDAMLMSAHIKKALGVPLPLAAFFDEPTLGALYELVRAALPQARLVPAPAASHE